MNQANPKILVADDEPLFLKTTGELLHMAGFDCTCVPDVASALAALARERFDLVVSDLNMPGNLKLELFRRQRSDWPQIPLIVVTGVPSLPTAIESLRLGIADYLLKPIRFKDLLASIRRTLEQRGEPAAPAKAGLASTETTDACPDVSRPERQTVRGPRPPRGAPPGGAPAASFPDIVGNSRQMRELFGVVERVSRTDTNVLITGESGTGKEVVARAIHFQSRRTDNAFQVIDCTSIAESLFESALFGHLRGSFTGAIRDEPGLLRQCDRGTAFFDEIGELPATLQAKLLRVVQEQMFTPVGSHEPVWVDTRFICATNRNLESEVHAGRFRRDLFYRLAVLHIELPPLRERGEDVVQLAQHFLKRLQGINPQVEKFSEEVLACFRRYRWPGNIRELRNVVERSLALSRSTRIERTDLPAALQADEPGHLSVGGSAAWGTHGEALEDAERDYLAALLARCGGNVSQSARQAGLSRQGLHKLLKKYGLSAADYRR